MCVLWFVKTCVLFKSLCWEFVDHELTILFCDLKFDSTIQLPPKYKAIQWICSPSNGTIVWLLVLSMLAYPNRKLKRFLQKNCTSTGSEVLSQCHSPSIVFEANSCLSVNHFLAPASTNHCGRNIIATQQWSQLQLQFWLLVMFWKLLRDEASYVLVKQYQRMLLQS